MAWTCPGAEAGCGFLGVRALRLGNNLVLRNLVGQKVVMPDTPFGVSLAFPTAQGDHQRCEVFPIKQKSMVETSPQHRRRAAIVFGSAEDRDGIGWTRLIVDGGPTGRGIATTIVDLSSSDGVWNILREGAIPTHEIALTLQR